MRFCCICSEPIEPSCNKQPSTALVSHHQQRSQEISDLAAHVLDFCGDVTTNTKPQLADLSDLLTHYDTIKQQQRSIQQQQKQHQQPQQQQQQAHHHPLGITAVSSLDDADKQSVKTTNNSDIKSTKKEHDAKTSEIFFQPAVEKSKRKPLIRPALPVLTSPKERLLDWNSTPNSAYNGQHDVTFCDVSSKTENSYSANNRMVDSGIEVSQSYSCTLHNNTSALLSHPAFKTDQSQTRSSKGDQSELEVSKSSDQSQPFSSDGYSSDSDDVTVHDTSDDTSGQVICNPMVHAS